MSKLDELYSRLEVVISGVEDKAKTIIGDIVEHLSDEFSADVDKFEELIKRMIDNKYFFANYCDWDIDYNYEKDVRCDFNCNLTEVFPKEKTIIIYE